MVWKFPWKLSRKSENREINILRNAKHSATNPSNFRRKIEWNKNYQSEIIKNLVTQMYITGLPSSGNSEKRIGVFTLVSVIHTVEANGI